MATMLHEPLRLGFTHQTTLDDAIERIKTVGPDRVIIRENGLSVPARDAKLNGVTADIVYIHQHDGWSLGAPRHLLPVARRQFEGSWLAAYYVATGEVRMLLDHSFRGDLPPTAA